MTCSGGCMMIQCVTGLSPKYIGFGDVLGERLRSPTLQWWKLSRFLIAWCVESKRSEISQLLDDCLIPSEMMIRVEDNHGNEPEAGDSSRNKTATRATLSFLVISVIWNGDFSNKKTGSSIVMVDCVFFSVGLWMRWRSVISKSVRVQEAKKQGVRNTWVRQIRYGSVAV